MSRIKGRCPECGGKGEVHHYCVYVCVRCERCGYLGTRIDTRFGTTVQAIDYWEAVANIKEAT